MEVHKKMHMEQTYLCRQCGETFSRKGHLERHMVVHSEEKPFRCTVCWRRFHLKFQLKEHKCCGKQTEHVGTDSGVWDDISQAEVELVYDDEPDDEGTIITVQVQNGQQDGNNLSEFSLSGYVSRCNSGSHGSGKQLLLCSLCGMGFVDEDLLLQHMVAHSVVKPVPWSVESPAYVHTDSAVWVQAWQTPGAEEKPSYDDKCEHKDDDRVLSSVQEQTGQGCTESNQVVNDTELKFCMPGYESDYLCSTPFIDGDGFVQSDISDSHLQEKQLLHCSVCHKGFEDRVSLTQHMRVHSLRQGQFQCFVCKKEFTWRRHLDKHMEVHVEKVDDCWDVSSGDQWLIGDPLKSEQDPGADTEVKKTFDFSESDSDSNDVWKESIKSQANHVKVEGNDANFWNGSGNPLLSQSHAPRVADWSQISSSGTSSRDEEVELRNVKEESEEVDVTFTHVKTEELNTVLQTPNTLKDNRTDMCKGERTAPRVPAKSFVCCRCGKGFRYQQTLEKHMASHTGTSSCVCPECGKKCLNAFVLKMHMKSHRVEKPFKCSICARKFTLKANLKAHMEFHDFGKQYSCRNCNRRLSWTELIHHFCKKAKPKT